MNHLTRYANSHLGTYESLDIQLWVTGGKLPEVVYKANTSSGCTDVLLLGEFDKKFNIYQFYF